MYDRISDLSQFLEVLVIRMCCAQICGFLEKEIKGILGCPCPRDVHILVSGTSGYVILHGKGGIKAEDGIKVANQLTLNQGFYFRLSGWGQ